MPAPIVVSRLSLRTLAIPLRRKFSHAGADRATAEPLIVAIELSDHTLGYGETHPRPYVSGETLESAVDTIRSTFVPLLVEFRPRHFGEALEAIAALPQIDELGRPITAARAAVELALLDAYSRAFDRSLEAIPGWLEELAFGPPGSTRTVTYSGVLSAAPAERIAGSIRKMRWFGLRDFKLKVGDDDDDARVRAAAAALAGPIARGKATLRLDANFAWDLSTATAKLTAWKDLPIAAVEQPLAKGDPAAWGTLAARSPFPLMADESLVTWGDAEALLETAPKTLFNIRISKNGGLIPAMRLAALARRHGTAYQLGCMVGETSLLSAAGRWFLQLVPDVRFAEGSYGRFLLADDITDPRLNLRWRGRAKPLSGRGLGVTVRPDKLAQFAARELIELPF